MFARGRQCDAARGSMSLAQRRQVSARSRGRQRRLGDARRRTPIARSTGDQHVSTAAVWLTGHSKPRPRRIAGCCHLANLTGWSQNGCPTILKVSKLFSYCTNIATNTWDQTQNLADSLYCMLMMFCYWHGRSQQSRNCYWLVCRIRVSWYGY